MNIELRDYFAAKAMQSLIIAKNIYDKDISTMAYLFADEMLKERELKQTES